MQLKAEEANEKFFDQVYPPDVIEFPYNQLPVLNSLKDHIFLEKNRFLSMSWLISTLGKLKDQGLGYILLEEALSKDQNN